MRDIIENPPQTTEVIRAHWPHYHIKLCPKCGSQSIWEYAFGASEQFQGVDCTQCKWNGKSKDLVVKRVEIITEHA